MNFLIHPLFQKIKKVYPSSDSYTDPGFFEIPISLTEQDIESTPWALFFPGDAPDKINYDLLKNAPTGILYCVGDHQQRKQDCRGIVTL